MSCCSLTGYAPVWTESEFGAEPLAPARVRSQPYRVTALGRTVLFNRAALNGKVGWMAAIRKATNKPPTSTHRGYSREALGCSETDLRKEQPSVRQEQGCDQWCSII